MMGDGDLEQRILRLFNDAVPAESTSPPLAVVIAGDVILGGQKIVQAVTSNRHSSAWRRRREQYVIAASTRWGLTAQVAAQLATQGAHHTLCDCDDASLCELCRVVARLRRHKRWIAGLSDPLERFDALMGGWPK